MEENETTPHNRPENEVMKQKPKEVSDWFLQDLVMMVNTKDLEIGITLTTHGFLVTGQLISGKQYFAEFGNLLETAVNPDIKNSIAGQYRELGESIYSEEKLKTDPPTYVHIKNVKFFQTSGNPLPISQGTFWRGRLSEISGFFIGSLSSSL